MRHSPICSLQEPSAWRPLIRLVSMEEDNMDGLIYLIGLIVVIMAILSFFGLR